MDSAQALRYGLRLRNTLRPCKRPIRRGSAAGLQSCLVHHQSSADECRTCWRGNRSGVGQLAAALALRWWHLAIAASLCADHFQWGIGTGLCVDFVPAVFVVLSLRHVATMD